MTLSLALVGCGRFGFGSVADAGVDAGADATPGAVPWQLVQSVGIENNRLVVALGAGHLAIVVVDVENGGTATQVTDGSTCNNYVEIPAAHALANRGKALDDDLQVFYARNTCAYAATISASVTSGDVGGIAIWEVSGMRTDDPFDTAAIASNQPATQEPLGPSIMTGEDGEFVISAALVDNDICQTATGELPPPCATHPGNEFTNDLTLTGNGFAHLTDPHAAAGVHRAAWDQFSSGTYGATAAAFRAGP